MEEAKTEVIENQSINKVVEKPAGRMVKKVVIYGSVLVFVYTFFVVISSLNASPGSGMVTFGLLLPVLPIFYIFYPLYFMILALRYAREKGNMDILDKIMFYVLLVYVGIVFLLVMSKGIGII